MKRSAVMAQSSKPVSSIGILEAIRGRRSVRDYSTGPIQQDLLQQLVDAAVQAPSAMNEQPWHFTIITDRGVLDRVARDAKAHMLAASKDAPHSEHAASLLGDEAFHIFYHAPALIVISAPSRARWSIENCSLAAQNLMLAAYAAGLGTCWIGFAQSWLQTDEGRRAIGLPEALLPVAPIIVGHPRSAPASVLRKTPSFHWIS